MKQFLSLFTFFFSVAIIIFVVGCNAEPSVEAKKNNKAITKVVSKDTPMKETLLEYDSLLFAQKDSLRSAAGTKSVVFNSTASKLYAMNLEGMSVYEIDEATKKITRSFKFKASKGVGWDYVTKVPVVSFQEKPVEGCLTNHDSILWVSLHNAKGIVPIHLHEKKEWLSTDTTKKKLYIKDVATGKKDSTYLPLIVTGKTPKVIAKTANDSFLLVSNWHSNSVSILRLNIHQYPYAQLITNIPVAAIPRGIVVDDANNKTYIGIMGSNTITVVDNKTWMKEKDIVVATNPRHIVMDDKNHLFVSYNSRAKVGCIDAATGTPLFSTTTKAQPRTIALSKNKKFLFVTCYEGNSLDVFNIQDTGFVKLYSLSCKGKPVGVDLFENNDKLEAWVCNYVGGDIKIFTFKKKKANQ